MHDKSSHEEKELPLTSKPVSFEAWSNGEVDPLKAIDAKDEIEKANPRYIAVVMYGASPGQYGPVGFLSSRTKFEMTKRLADPSISSVVGIIRGKKIDFQEARKISF